MKNCSAQIERLKTALRDCDTVVIGAGSGLSTAAGFIYTGERFEKYFSDFAQKYGIQDMYSGGFYPFPTQETFWAYWSRYIFINRYQDAPKPVSGRWSCGRRIWQSPPIFFRSARTAASL